MVKKIGDKTCQSNLDKGSFDFGLSNYYCISKPFLASEGCF